MSDDQEIVTHQGERHVEQYISWNFEEFTGFLLSKENCITVGSKKESCISIQFL